MTNRADPSQAQIVQAGTPTPAHHRPPDHPATMSASSEPLTRAACTALDAADPLAPLREQFVHPPGVIYLDGNSLGLQPVAAAARVGSGAALPVRSVRFAGRSLRSTAIARRSASLIWLVLFFTTSAIDPSAVLRPGTAPVFRQVAMSAALQLPSPVCRCWS